MLITNFASGELSKKLYGRVDMQQYYQGASRLSNFEIIPTGGIQRRTGLKKCSTIPLSGEAILIPFIIDKSNNFILECSAGKCKIWKNGEKFMETAEKQYELILPYASIGELREVQYAQNYDKLILVHENYTPREITYSNGGMTIAEMSFNFLPQINLDDDYDFITIVKAVATTTVDETNKKLTYIDPTDDQQHVKDKIDINSLYIAANSNIYKYKTTSHEFKDWDSDPDVDDSLFTSAGKYPKTVTFFNNRLYFGGTRKAPQAVYASATPDTAGTRYRDFATYQKYVTVNQQTKNPDMHIFTCDVLLENIETDNNRTELINVSQNLTAALKNANTEYYVSGPNIPVGTKVINITATTIRISKALNIEEDLYGQTMTIQLWVDATNPSADDYEYKVTSRNVTTSDCSFFFEMASEENDAIKFLASNKYLTIGTESAIWCVPASITALNIVAENQGRYGSDSMQALCIDQAVCFFAPGKYGIREFYYNQSTEAFQTNNIAILAEQMLQESPAMDFDYINNPYNKIVIVRADGTAVQMLYDKNNGIAAWNRIEHGNGTIKSCAITHGDKESDTIYFVVKEGLSYFLERTVDDAVYLDGYTEYSTEIATAYTTDAILWNRTKNKHCSITDIPEDFIAAGDVVYIGYSFISDIVSMPVIANDPTGKKRITDLLVRFIDSYMPTMKCGDQPDEDFNTDELPFSGIKKITYPGKYERDVTFRITASEPYPVNILAISATLA